MMKRPHVEAQDDLQNLKVERFARSTGEVVSMKRDNKMETGQRHKLASHYVSRVPAEKMLGDLTELTFTWIKANEAMGIKNPVYEMLKLAVQERKQNNALSDDGALREAIHEYLRNNLETQTVRQMNEIGKMNNQVIGK